MAKVESLAGDGGSAGARRIHWRLPPRGRIDTEQPRNAITAVKQQVGNYILEKAASLLQDETERPALEITPAMIEAGVRVLDDLDPPWSGDAYSAAKAVYAAMFSQLANRS
jgi:hypothetical protein